MNSTYQDWPVVNFISFQITLISKSRAAKKIFKDLHLATGLQTLPVVFVNEKAIGNYEALKRSNKVGKCVNCAVIIQ